MVLTDLYFMLSPPWVSGLVGWGWRGLFARGVDAAHEEDEPGPVVADEHEVRAVGAEDVLRRRLHESSTDAAHDRRGGRGFRGVFVHLQ